ncbi:hypothetical protein BJ085DRAFT_30589 [Dimargaris cristalligena]|uniref:Uncharacterized protein n=1 Tax=Dimargaris cristalligena TaxID=215637 RepID=A0A4P9ZR23_9FUNG|nr:hypothetical protein BJ085DRAFT_30589 [Dimargaris cristalligena]|eukprot:RKP35883.1 hypothetical protein BJ085DRAFT_30589 [Dimargaris cristalligena]
MGQPRKSLTMLVTIQRHRPLEGLRPGGYFPVKKLRRCLGSPLAEQPPVFFSLPLSLTLLTFPTKSRPRRSHQRPPTSVWGLLHSRQSGPWEPTPITNSAWFLEAESESDSESELTTNQTGVHVGFMPATEPRSPASPGLTVDTTSTALFNGELSQSPDSPVEPMGLPQVVDYHLFNQHFSFGQYTAPKSQLFPAPTRSNSIRSAQVCRRGIRRKRHYAPVLAPTLAVRSPTLTEVNSVCDKDTCEPLRTPQTPNNLSLCSTASSATAVTFPRHSTSMTLQTTTPPMSPLERRMTDVRRKKLSAPLWPTNPPPLEESLDEILHHLSLTPPRRPGRRMSLSADTLSRKPSKSSMRSFSTMLQSAARLFR